MKKLFTVFLLSIFLILFFINITPGYFKPKDVDGCMCGLVYSLKPTLCHYDQNYISQCEHTKFWDSALSFVNKFDLNK